jgi:hypothetical protein
MEPIYKHFKTETEVQNKERLIDTVCALINSTIFANPYISVILFVHVLHKMRLRLMDDAQCLHNEGEMNSLLQDAYDSFFLRKKNRVPAEMEKTFDLQISTADQSLKINLHELPYHVYMPMFNVYFARVWSMQYNEYRHDTRDYVMYQGAEPSHVLQQYMLPAFNKYVYPLRLFGHSVHNVPYPAHFLWNPEYAQQFAQRNSEFIDDSQQVNAVSLEDPDHEIKTAGADRGCEPRKEKDNKKDNYHEKGETRWKGCKDRLFGYCKGRK